MPLLCGLEHVNGVGGEIATTETQAERRRHIEKAECEAQPPKATTGFARADRRGTQETDSSSCWHVSQRQQQVVQQPTPRPVLGALCK